jgi:hypothetical protein
MICPSRGRPANVAELIEVWRDVTYDAALLVAVDDDDPELRRYRDIFTNLDLGIGEPRIHITIGPRGRLGPTLNRLALLYASSFRALGFLGDDHRPRTDGWDRRVVEALDQLGTGLVYGNDLLQGGNLPTAVAMTSDVVRTLGWMVPPGMIHMYIDNAWLDLGRGLDRIRYLHDVVIEHMHPVAQKSEWDAGYAEVNSAEMYARDLETYRHWQETSLAADVSKLRELVGA